MTDTTNTVKAVDYDAIEAAETQRVLAAIALFREGLAALKSTEGAECNYEWEALQAACVEGQVMLADFADRMSAFIEDCWPAEVKRASAAAVAQARAAAYALAAVYGQCAHIPQVEDLGVPVTSTAGAA